MTSVFSYKLPYFILIETLFIPYCVQRFRPAIYFSPLPVAPLLTIRFFYGFSFKGLLGLWRAL